MSDSKPSLYPAQWRPSSLKEILNRQYEPPPWVLEDLLPKDSGLLSSGLPHACKSLNWLAASIESVAMHKVWHKFPADKVKRALFIETEDPRWLIEDRVRGIATGLALKPTDLGDLGFGLACTGPFSLASCYNQLSKLIEEWEPDWVVLSTLQGLIQGIDWKEQKEMGAINAIIVRLQRQCPIVVITHSPRSGLRRASGTITQDANYLTLMHFEKRDMDGHLVVNVEGDSKMGTDLNFDLRVDLAEVNDAGKLRTQVRGVRYQYETMSKRDRIINALAQHPTADVAAIALICECKERYVREVMKELKIRKDSVGTN